MGSTRSFIPFKQEAFPLLKLLAAINRYGSWILMVLMLLFILTGLAITKNFMDPRLAKQLHENVLPLPFYVLLLTHVFFPLRAKLAKGTIFKSEKTATAYAYAVCGTLLVLFFWLHFR